MPNCFLFGLCLGTNMFFVPALSDTEMFFIPVLASGVFCGPSRVPPVVPQHPLPQSLSQSPASFGVAVEGCLDAANCIKHM